MCIRDSPIYIPLVPPDFHYDRAVLEQAFRDGAKALILCNPSNPCGKVFTMGEMEEIAELAKRYDAFVITDEVYEYIIYDGNRHISMAALPGMYERTITCSSLSKTYSMTCLLYTSTVLSVSPDKIVTLASSEGLKKIQTKAVILTMGCRERTRGALGIPGERPTGVFTAGVAQAYINLYNRMIIRL